MVARIAKLLAVIAGIGVMLVPIVTHNHIYKVMMAQTDLPFHSQVIQSYTIGKPLQEPMRYMGEIIFGWTLGMMNRMLHLDPKFLFLMFMVVSLLAICITLYYFGKLAGGQVTAWLVLTIGCLSTTSILTHISWGTIYNAINMFLILPWAVILLALWYSRRKLPYLLGGLSLFVLFSAFHLSALYIPYMTGIFLVALIIWLIAKRNNKREAIIYGGISILVLVINMGISLWAFNPSAVLDLNESGKTNMAIMFNPLDAGRFAYQFFETYLRASTTIVGVIVLACLIYYRKVITFSPAIKATLVMLGALSLALVGSVALNFVGDIKRQQVDAAGIIAIIIALLLGEIFKIKTFDWKIKVACCAVIAIGSLNTLCVWIMP